MDEDTFHIELLNNGLYTWQRVGIVLAEVCTKAPPECIARANKLFKMKLKQTLTEVLAPVSCPWFSSLYCSAHLQRLKEWRVDFEEAPAQKERIDRLLQALDVQDTVHLRP